MPKPWKQMRRSGLFFRCPAYSETPSLCCSPLRMHVKEVVKYRDARDSTRMTSVGLDGLVLVARKDNVAGVLAHLVSLNSSDRPHPRFTYSMDGQMAASTYAYFDVRYAMDACDENAEVVTLIASGCVNARCRSEGAQGLKLGVCPDKSVIIGFLVPPWRGGSIRRAVLTSTPTPTQSLLVGCQQSSIGHLCALLYAMWCARPGYGMTSLTEMWALYCTQAGAMPAHPILAHYGRAFQ